MSSGYEKTKRWRLCHPKKRYRQKKRYCARHRDTFEEGRNAHTRWTRTEMDRITAPNRPPDTILTKELGRSLQAIQIKRNKIKTKY